MKAWFVHTVVLASATLDFGWLAIAFLASLVAVLLFMYWQLRRHIDRKINQNRYLQNKGGASHRHS